MSEWSWDNPELQEMCARCIYKDADVKLCHAVEPPLEKPFVPNNTSDCYFIPESYWNRVEDERKKDIEREKTERTKRYYKLG